ncbi:1-acyl-sn-glycerol-3-phosphate acyltransferase [Crocinitomicaceae bacterium]|nr:1-acyl-sn-glycerol-3-phosphate acyltransferase [Crocinitomicaceae bacterium]
MYYILNYTLRLYFRNIKVHNKPSKFGKTIYVSNHAASFMDPLVIAAFNRSVVYFLTRSDVFTPFTKPIFWIAHMLPIYRQRDGVNTKEKNNEVFKKCTETLLRNRNLLIFGEGVTDDQFVRRLKPLKKGALRIGFTTLEACDWKENVYIAAIGCNYSNPSRFRSDLLIKNSKPILLNDFKEEYLENPSKVISKLTLKIQKVLQSELTHVDAIEDTSYHERIMMVQRKGMCDTFSNRPNLKERWSYSSSLATKINEGSIQLTDDIKDEIDSYFNNLKDMGVSDDLVFDSKSNSFKTSQFLFQLMTLPIAVLGFIHCSLFYFSIKEFVEKKFRRDVFWGSTKLIMMIFIAGPINLLVLVFLPAFIGWPLSVLYFLAVPFFGFIFLNALVFWKRLYRIQKLKGQNLTKIFEARTQLKQNLDNFVK